VARFAVRAVDIRSRLLDIDRILTMQVDPYLFMRELYLQNRIAQISDGAISRKPTDVSPIEQEILEN